MKAVSNEIDVTELKNLDRTGTILHAIGILLIEILLTLFVFFVIGRTIVGYAVGLIILFAVVFIFFPSPFPSMPQKYTISSKSIMFDGKKIVTIPSNFKVKVNKERMFVSINHPRRGEVLRLYSRDPVELSEILENIRKK